MKNEPRKSVISRTAPKQDQLPLNCERTPAVPKSFAPSDTVIRLGRRAFVEWAQFCGNELSVSSADWLRYPSAGAARRALVKDATAQCQLGCRGYWLRRRKACPPVQRAGSPPASPRAIGRVRGRDRVFRGPCRGWRAGLAAWHR